VKNAGGCGVLGAVAHRVIPVPIGPTSEMATRVGRKAPTAVWAAWVAMPPMPTNSLVSADWGETTIAAGDLAGAITRLKQECSGGYLLAQGGARFARSLVETGLIDEYRLVVHPVVLGAGERLFNAPLTIEPMSTTTFSRGAVAHVFAAHP
jgi:riboflavin biosynthesis pyrimidine reductase